MATNYIGDPFYEEEEFQTFQQPQHFNLNDYPYRGPVQSGYTNTGNIVGYPGEAGYDDNLSFERDFRNNRLSDTGVQMAYKTPRTIADQNRVLGMTFAEDEDPQGLAALFQNLNIDPSSWGTSLKNKASTGWNLAQQLPGMAMSAMTGIPGIGALMGALGNSFEDRQLTGDIMDESGNMYSAEALNKQNALGGYYTDPARSARRRTNRIRNMLNRQKAGKTISTKNLQTLQKQADNQNIHNIQQYTGKPVSQYRMDRPASERQYTGHGKSGMGRDPDRNKAQGGRVRFSDGGLATLFTRRG